LLLGDTSSGKSSLINYLGGEKLVLIGNGGDPCTKDIKSYEVTLLNKKLRIFDTPGFNNYFDFSKISDGKVASRIKL
jgi:predicted GTPase